MNSKLYVFPGFKDIILTNLIDNNTCEDYKVNNNSVEYCSKYIGSIDIKNLGFESRFSLEEYKKDTNYCLNNEWACNMIGNRMKGYIVGNILELEFKYFSKHDLIRINDVDNTKLFLSRSLNRYNTKFEVNAIGGKPMPEDGEYIITYSPQFSPEAPKDITNLEWMDALKYYVEILTGNYKI